MKEVKEIYQYPTGLRASGNRRQKTRPRIEEVEEEDTWKNKSFGNFLYIPRKF